MTDLPHTAQLLAIMAHLRDKEKGCPWDIEQNFATIAPYTIEEAYEVAEAIASGDRLHMKEELGDLLLQVVFHAQMAREEKSFDFEDVAQAINDKMIRRHPHVFGDETYNTAAAQTVNWENIKQAEREAKAKDPSVLADVPSALPALMRAEKLQKRVARVGFDWPDTQGVIAKIEEELQEVKEALGSDAFAEEIGDLLFAVVNLARFEGIDPEEALRQANRKFTRRFQHVEQSLGKKLKDSSLEEMEAAWNDAKAREKVA